MTLNCNNVNLKKGSKGETVKELQTILQKQGYYTGKIDGDYGTLTTEAVKKLQKAQGNTTDGWFGKKTCTKDNITYEKTYSGGSDPTIMSDGRLNTGLYRNTILNNIPLNGDFEVTITAEITTNNRHEISLFTSSFDKGVNIQKDVGSTVAKTDIEHKETIISSGIDPLDGVHYHSFKRVGDNINYYRDFALQAIIPWEYNDTLYPGGLKWQNGNTFIEKVGVGANPYLGGG